jgi:hypothetical protein
VMSVPARLDATVEIAIPVHARKRRTFTAAPFRRRSRPSMVEARVLVARVVVD